MSKANYIPWSPSEEQSLRDWLSRHQHLTWKKKSKEYHRDTGIARGPESIRGKYNQLVKGIYRRRSISAKLSKLHHKKAQAGGHQRPNLMPSSPNPPPALKLRAPDPQARQLFQHFHPEESLTRGQRRSCEYNHRQARESGFELILGQMTL
jgi:hypothetical protein